MPRKQVSDEIKQEILRKHLDEGRTVKVFAMSISLLTVLSKDESPNTVRNAKKSLN